MLALLAAGKVDSTDAAPLIWSSPFLLDHQGRSPGLESVACPSTGFCLAVDRLGNALSSNSPLGGESAWSTTRLDNPNLVGATCPSARLCVAVGLEGEVVASTDPGGGPSSWSAHRIEHGLLQLAVSCPSVTFCVVAGGE